MHRFEIFALEKYHDLETRVKGQSVKVIANDTISKNPCDFQLMFHSNCGSILHRLQHLISKNTATIP